MNILVFDIESALHPIFRASQYPPNDLKHPEWATWTDEQCVADYQGARGSGPDAFMPYSFHRPISIAYIVADRQSLEIQTFEVLDELTTTDYRHMIGSFWTLVNGPPPAVIVPPAPFTLGSLVDELAEDIPDLSDMGSSTRARFEPPVLVHFNGRGYDIPVLEHAAFELGLWMGDWYKHTGEPYLRRRNRYSEHNFDLQEQFNNFSGKGPAGGLDRMAKSIGLPGKMGINGADVWKAYEKGLIKDISTYCMTDVADTYFVFVRQMVVESLLTLDQERQLRLAFKHRYAEGRLAEYCSKLQIPNALS